MKFFTIPWQIVLLTNNRQLFAPLNNIQLICKNKRAEDLFKPRFYLNFCMV